MRTHDTLARRPNIMKLCAYCGRENDDTAVACRECGTDEFNSTALAEAPLTERPPPPLSSARLVAAVAESGPLDGVKSLAIVGHHVVSELVSKLSDAGIACESRSVTEEGGGTARELLVEDLHYDAACDVVEAWCEDQARKDRLICPKCQARKLERVPHDTFRVVYKCMDCGCEVIVEN